MSSLAIGIMERVGQEAQSGLSNPMGLATKIGGGVAVAGSLLKSFTIIHEGEMGLRVGFGTPRYRHGSKKGQLRPSVGPGLHFVAPFTHSVKKVNVRDRNNNLPDQEITTSDAGQIVVRSAICWNVRADDDNPYRALFEADGEGKLTDQVVDICTAGLRKVLDGNTLQMARNEEWLMSGMKENCHDRLLKYGVNLNDIYLQTAAQTAPQMLQDGMFALAANEHPLTSKGYRPKSRQAVAAASVLAFEGINTDYSQIHRFEPSVQMSLD